MKTPELDSDDILAGSVKELAAVVSHGSSPEVTIVGVSGFIIVRELEFCHSVAEEIGSPFLGMASASGKSMNKIQKLD